METFAWPWQYNFPPFYTIQPTEETRKKQFEAWHRLILDFCRTRKLYLIDVNEAKQSELFKNEKISRSLSAESIIQLLEYVASKRNAEPVDASKTRWYIYWHPLAKWADMLFSWSQDNAYSNHVCTLYELTSIKNSEFSDMNEQVLMKILHLLEKDRRAEVINIDGKVEGVKFL